MERFTLKDIVIHNEKLAKFIASYPDPDSNTGSHLFDIKYLDNSGYAKGLKSTQFKLQKKD